MDDAFREVIRGKMREGFFVVVFWFLFCFFVGGGGFFLGCTEEFGFYFSIICGTLHNYK